MRVAGIAATLILVQPAQAESVRDWRPLIAEASVRCRIPVRWIERVMGVESAGRTRWRGQAIRSRAGAMGLMQLMPATWETMRSMLGLGNDPDEPRDNILAGACYLRMMYDRFGYPGLFAAYNAGPRRYAAHLASGRPLPSETVVYLDTITDSVRTVHDVPSKLPRTTMFAVQLPRRSEAGGGAANPSSSLFALRRDAR
jgi:soluble lytic murein transglycosylase-like protein